MSLPAPPSASPLQAIVMALVQGMTELFPVSSLGHAVLLPALFGWHLDQKGPEFLPFLVVLHLGTATALLLYFWRDWLGFARAVFGYGPCVDDERRVFGHVVVATLPAVVVGFTLEHILRGFFAAPVLAAAFLIVNGILLFAGERLRHRAGSRTLAAMSWKAALAIGACQALALIPGISRSGATMVGGLLAGLKHREAARFSFLMATPVIAGAGVLEVPKLVAHLQAGGGFAIPTVILAGIVAGVTAFLSTAFLMRYFKRHEIEALDPFAFYCWALGLLALIILL
ncbi:MAG TPA: undecaprenyl-diphosphate phosphatase [Alphaproteobacteria bacterium]|nr:undecaprenyl-diphosphate phosphatase [Alphaproteobacteria bacterium]